MAFNRNKSKDCPKCSHSLADHFCPYGDINEAHEAYSCQLCDCVRTVDEVEVPPGLIYVQGVGWDYKENAHKYKKSLIRSK